MSKARNQMEQRVTERAPDLSGHMLVMDDDDAIRLGLQVLLEMLGNTVVTSVNGDEALAAYRAARKAGTPFQAVILDLTIPGSAGGGEVIKRLRKLDPEVRAIICSGDASDPVMANFREHGFRAVLMKPFRTKQLQAILNEVLAPG